MIDHKRLVFLDRVFVRRPFFSSSVYRVENLAGVLNLNVFKNALWLASPEFYRALEKKGFAFELLDKKERLTALKFYNRMSFRATPFGAFAGFALAPWHTGERKKWPVNQDALLHLLSSVRAESELLENTPLEDAARIAVNPTLYAVNAGWRYSRYEVDGSGRLSFFIYQLQHQEADAMLLGFLARKAMVLGELAGYLVELTDCTEEEARLHLIGLLEEQVLLTDNTLSLFTGSTCFKLFTTDYSGNLVLPAAVPGAENGLKHRQDGRSFYAGLEIRDLNSLNEVWQGEIRDVVKVLDLLAPVPPENALDKFIEDFGLKFGERSVPLLEALDPDLGVSYDGRQQPEDHELLKGLDFGQEQKTVEQLTWTPVHKLFMKIWLQNKKRSDGDPVVLEDSELSELTSPGLPLPPSLSFFCSTGDGKLIVHHAGGATANALAGRFSAFSEDFSAFCRTVARQEAAANPEVIFAEVLQVSHRKTDNINRRSQVYGHVIPLNCFPAGDCVLPADLDVCIKAGEIMLVHRASGKRVIVRLPTAFNFHHSDMPLFRFLCSLQYRSVRANLDFDPQKLFPGLNFYPRIEYSRSILSLARWYLNKMEIENLTRQPLSISRLHLFCRERGIPVRIAAGRGDQQMVFNLSDDQDALFFLETLPGAENLMITEFPGGHAGIANSGNDFCSQFVVSLVNPDPVYTSKSPVPEEIMIVRDFLPGSEWVYMKIYATDQSAAAILLESLVPWIEQNSQRIRQWFFVRYYDPESHLRIRFRVAVADVKDLQYELQSLIGNIGRVGLVQRFYFDTYQREIERYTSRLIAGIEELFFRGSQRVARYLLDRYARADEGDLLWPVLHCYQMVSVFFGSDGEQMTGLCKWASEAFFLEHGGEKKLKRSMDDRFRDLRPGLTGLTGDAGAAFLSIELESALRLLSAASMELKPLARQQLIADMVHMQVNRIFLSGQRRHEAFIWHCLLKLAVTDVKRKKAGVKALDGR